MLLMRFDFAESHTLNSDSVIDATPDERAYDDAPCYARCHADVERDIDKMICLLRLRAAAPAR